MSIHLLGLDQEVKSPWTQADLSASISGTRLAGVMFNGNDGLSKLGASWANFEDSPAVNPIEGPPQAIDIITNTGTIGNTLLIPRAPQDSPDTPDTPDNPDTPDVPGSSEIPETPEDSEPTTRPPPPPPATTTPNNPDSPPPTTRRPYPPANTPSPDPPPSNPGRPDPPDTTERSDLPPDTTERQNPPPIDTDTDPPSPSTTVNPVSSNPPSLDTSIASILPSSSSDYRLQGWGDVNGTPGSPSPSTSTPDGESSGEPPTGNDRVNTGAIIGAVVAGVIVCVVVAGCLLWRRRRRRRSEVPHLVAFSSSGGVTGEMRDDVDVERAADPVDVQANRTSRTYSDDLDLDLNEKERLSQLFAFPSHGPGHHRASASAASSADRSSLVNAPSSIPRDSLTTCDRIVSDTRQVTAPSPPTSSSLSSPTSTLESASDVVATPQDFSALVLPHLLNDAELNRIAAAVSKMLSPDPESARTYVVTIHGEERAAQDGVGVGAACRVEAERVPPPPYGL